MARSGTGPVNTRMLADRLRQRRESRRQSLGAVSTAADISTAYLQKLETAAVKSPSPRVLFGLAQALELGYPELMRLAGYVVPNEDARKVRNRLTHAASSIDLSEEEGEELAKYLEWYRHQHRER